MPAGKDFRHEEGLVGNPHDVEAALNRGATPLKLSLWQAEELARWVRANDDPTDDTLSTAHVALTELEDDGERMVEAVTEAGARIVLWHDGSDVTSDYPATGKGSTA